MTHRTPLTAAILATAAFVTTLGVASDAEAGLFGPAEVKRWDVCNWEQIPDSTLDRIMRRSDFEDILRRMFDHCPESALGLTDRPTASVSQGPAERINGEAGGPGNSGVTGRSRGGNGGGNPGGTPDNDPPSNNPDPTPDFGLPG